MPNRAELPASWLYTKPLQIWPDHRGKGWCQPKRLPIVGDRLFDLAHGFELGGPVVVGNGKARHNSDRLGVVRDCVTVVFFRGVDQGPVEVVAGVFWLYLYRPFEVAESFLQIAEDEVSAAPIQQSAVILRIV